MNAKAWDFPGGLHLPTNKAQSTAGPIVRAPLPSRLILPLQQHTGAPALPCVDVGERVLKGQMIASPGSAISAAVHAPTSGTVVAIGEQPYPHPSGLLAEAIVIDADGLDEWAPLQPCPDYRLESPAALLECIRQAGIAGLGYGLALHFSGRMLVPILLHGVVNSVHLLLLSYPLHLGLG